MKRFFSLSICFLVTLVLVQYRITSPGIHSGKELNITQWDAFGYYAYLPAIFIYDDYKKLEWLPAVEEKYHVTGGGLAYQAQMEKNGNYVFKYLGGVAILEAPFFLIGHFIAKNSGYPADGFSPPYQYALSFGLLLYTLLGLLLLRRILSRWFSDRTTGITLLLITLATNFIQYAAHDAGMSHVWIFPLYVLILYATIKWHERPGAFGAAAIGYIIGLATISRPTEAVMLFIPIFWATQSKDIAKAKWRLVREHRSHLLWACLGGLLGILPQLIYWKLSSGSFIYDVGSKWAFLNPHFRVLFGWEKGWFIYTPVTLFFIAGMFFMKGYEFRKSVLWFCLLNIYIIIAWDDWRYGGSYSTRALVQSYPLFALPLAAMIERISTRKWKLVFYVAAGYLVFLNCFQTWQYSKGILHYNDMNRHYYGRIYLNAHPDALDLSLLDTEDFLEDESAYKKQVIAGQKKAVQVKHDPGTETLLQEVPLQLNPGRQNWLRVDAKLKAPGHLWQSSLRADLRNGDSVKHQQFRLLHALAQDTAVNQYSFYIKVPDFFSKGVFRLSVFSEGAFEGTLPEYRVTELVQ